MPKNVPPELEEKFKSCKEKVMAQGNDEQAAYGICYVSVVEGKSLAEATKSFYLSEEVKAGRMISAANAEIIKGIIALAKQLVPDEEADTETPYAQDMQEHMAEMQAPMKSDLLVSYGGAVKSIAGKPGGYAVRFGGKDLTADEFDNDTNYGFAGETTKKVDILFHHAQPIETKSGKQIQITEPIGQATLKMADDGVLIEDAILFNADRYAKHLDKLGWSTGAAAHSVVREKGHIKQWQIAEVSLTPIPAEPRNMVAAKSLAGAVVDMDDEALPDFREIGREIGVQLAQNIQQIRQNAR